MSGLSVSLSHTLVVKVLTREIPRVKGVCRPVRPQCGNELPAVTFMRPPGSQGGWRLGVDLLRSTQIGNE
jgi:hypothetical protein